MVQEEMIASVDSLTAPNVEHHRVGDLDDGEMKKE